MKFIFDKDYAEQNMEMLDKYVKTHYLMKHAIFATDGTAQKTYVADTVKELVSLLPTLKKDGMTKMIPFLECRYKDSDIFFLRHTTDNAVDWFNEKGLALGIEVVDFMYAKKDSTSSMAVSLRWLEESLKTAASSELCGTMRKCFLS